MEKKILIIANGEGRGHLTQVLSFLQIIKDSPEYNVVGVVLGTTIGKDVPDYFKNSVGNYYKIETPQFVKKNNRSISISKTIYKNIFNIKKYIDSANRLNNLIELTQPDYIINFYELMTGIWKFTLGRNNKAHIVSIGHQYLLEHSYFKFPNKSLEKYGVLLLNKITSYGSLQKWCLSFYNTYSENNLYSIPPLLRSEIYDGSIKDDGFILVYLCSEGYLVDIEKIADENPNVKFQVYLKTSEVKNLKSNLVVNPISDVNFMNDMKNCSGVMMSSGFESVCEAKFYNKPCLLVPIENQYEQLCNAHDAKVVDGGLYSPTFDYIKLKDYMEKYNPDNSEYVKWLSKCNEFVLYRLYNII